jgi:protein SCO1/2
VNAPWKALLLVLSIAPTSSCSRISEAELAHEREDGLPFFSDSDLTPAWPTRAASASPAFHRVRTFRFTNQSGTAVTEELLDGKISVINFFFATCGGICPRMTDNLAKVQEAFPGDDVVLLSHSVTPEIDTVSALKSYAAMKGIQPTKWHLVTGERDEIYRAARESYFADEGAALNGNSDDFLHTEKVYLLDRQRRIRGVYNGTRAMDIDRLMEDIRTLRGASHPGARREHPAGSQFSWSSPPEPLR